MARLGQRRTCVVESALLTLREGWSMWCDAPAMRVCICLWLNTLAPLRAVKLAGAKRIAIAAWQVVSDYRDTLALCGLQLEVAKRIVTTTRREDLGCMIHWCTCNLNTSLLLHLKNFPMGHQFLIAIFSETSASARVGHYLVYINISIW